MFRLNSVGAIFLFLLAYVRSNLVKGLASGDDFFAIFGAYKVPFGKAFIFDEFARARINLAIDFDPFIVPELLECEQYTTAFDEDDETPTKDTHSEDSTDDPLEGFAENITVIAVDQTTTAKPSPKTHRRKRDVNDTVTILDATPTNLDVGLDTNWTNGPGYNKFCAYNYDENDVNLEIESEAEERRFQKILKENLLDRLICSNGWSESCLVRSLHSAKISIYWFKVLNKNTRKFEMRTKVDIYNPVRKGRPYSKEIMYRDKDLLTEFIEQKQITSNYKCLPSPYNGRKWRVKKAPEVLEAEAEYKDRAKNMILSKEYNGELDKSNVGSNRYLTVIRNQLPYALAKGIEPQRRTQYDEIVALINPKILSWANIEFEMHELQKKIDERRYALEQEDNKMNLKCIEWLRARESIVKLCEEGDREFPTENMCQDVTKSMSTDLKLICANSALVKLRGNAILSSHRRRVDELQMRLLNVFGITVEDHAEKYRLFANVTKEGQPEYIYNMILSDMIQVEIQQLDYERKITELQRRAQELEYGARTRGNKADELMNSAKLLRKKINSVYDELRRAEIESAEALKEMNSTNLEQIQLLTEHVNKIMNNTEGLRNKLTGQIKRLDPGIAPEEKLRIINREMNDQKANWENVEKIIKKKNEMINELEIRRKELESNASKLEDEHLKILKERDDVVANVSNCKTESGNLKQRYDQLIEANRLQLLEQANEKFTKLETLYKQTESELINLKDLTEEERKNCTRDKNALSNDKTLALNDCEKNWSYRYKRDTDRLETEKQNLESQLEALKINTTDEQFDKGILTGKVRAIEKQLQKMRTIEGKRKLRRREISGKIDINIGRACQAINKNLNTIINNLKMEEEAIDVQRKRRDATDVLNLAWNFMNWQKIEEGSGVQEKLIKKQYDEFVKLGDFQSKLDLDLTKTATYHENKLQNVQESLNASHEALKDIVRSIRDLKEFSQANRIVLAFVFDILTTQRMLLSLIHNNGIKTRVFEGLAQLKSGLLPEDFVNQKELKELLLDAEAHVHSDLKLAFSWDNLGPYFTFPLARAGKSKQGLVIDIYIPLVRKERSNCEFDMWKLKSSPFYCFNSSLCNFGERYQMLTNEDVLLTKNDALKATLKRTDLECFTSDITNRVCWTILDEKLLAKDDCISSLDRQNISEDCKFRKTQLPVVPLKTGKHIFRSFIAENTVKIERRSFDLGELESSHKLSEGLLNSRIRSLPKNLLKQPVILETDEMRRTIENLKRQIPNIEKVRKEFQEKTFEKLVKDAKATAFIKNNRFWKIVELLYMMIPVVIVGILLIISNNWPLTILYSISVQFQSAEASVLGDMASKLSTFLLYQVLDLVWKLVCFAVSVMIAAAILAGLAFIVYNTLYKRTCIHHVHGKMKAIESGQNTAWFLILSIVFEENKITHTNRYIISIRKELPYDSSLDLHTADKYVTLIEYQGNIALSAPISVHFRTARPRLDSEQIAINDDNITWGIIKPPSLSKLNGRIAMVSLEKLNLARPGIM